MNECFTCKRDSVICLGDVISSEFGILHWCSTCGALTWGDNKALITTFSKFATRLPELLIIADEQAKIHLDYSSTSDGDS